MCIYIIGCEALAQEQDEWLDRELQDSKDKGALYTIAFSHIPPFIQGPDDPDE